MRNPADYDPIESAPDGIKWKPVQGRPSKTHVTLYSIGDVYKLVRVLETGEVAYFKRKDTDAISLSKKIDDEPDKAKQVRYRVGQMCWLIDDAGRWYCCEVMKRGPRNIELRSVTGFDAERTAAWPYGEVLAFSPKTVLFRRLRPLKARIR